jgi:Protein of unknown function (DUF3237)
MKVSYVALSLIIFIMNAIQTQAQQAPGLEFFCELRVKVEKAYEVGEVPRGTRRIIPIVGGTVTGPSIRGTILTSGSDWQIVRKDGVAELEALYQFKTDDGTIIFIRNNALRVASPEVAAKIAKGEQVDATQYYFRGTPRFEAPSGKYSWINDTIFVCTGERNPEEVLIKVWRLL